MIGGNTTNLNDFNNMRYKWVSDWYRQAMNNFWIPEEINLTQDTKDYPLLDEAERTAYDKILSFLVFLDSLQSNNLPTISEYITANEVNLCLHIQAFQECVHSQSYSYMLDTICSPEKRNDILYQWKTDEHLLKRNTFIGNCYNEFQPVMDMEFLDGMWSIDGTAKLYFDSTEGFYAYRTRWGLGGRGEFELSEASGRPMIFFNGLLYKLPPARRRRVAAKPERRGQRTHHPSKHLPPRRRGGDRRMGHKQLGRHVAKCPGRDHRHQLVPHAVHRLLAGLFHEWHHERRGRGYGPLSLRHTGRAPTSALVVHGCHSWNSPASRRCTA